MLFVFLEDEIEMRISDRCEGCGVFLVESPCWCLIMKLMVVVVLVLVEMVVVLVEMVVVLVLVEMVVEVVMLNRFLIVCLMV